MKIKYRFTFSWSEARVSQLESIGLKVDSTPNPGGPLGGIGISHVVEGASGWTEACDLIRAWDGRTTVTTEFTAAEVDGVAHCALQLVHGSGYPQPEDDFAYLEQTYDMSKCCSTCGEGAVQVSPFRVKRTLKWGRNAFLKLNWVEEACFMQRPVWEEHLSRFGIGALPVEDTKGKELDDIIQLDLGPAVPLAMGEGHGIRCGVCGRERFPWHDRGFFPAPISPPDLPLFRSVQRFGVENACANGMIVSAEVIKVIKSAGLRGAESWPCMPPG